MTTLDDLAVSERPGERESFARLQRRLPALWRAIHENPHLAHSSVVVPSLSFDREELEKIEGVSCYEERLLFALMRLRHPAARVLYVTSQPIHPEIVGYYLQLLAGVPSSHAHRRLGLLCMADASPEPLTARILRRPRAIARIRDWIGDPSRAYLTCFNSTRLERRLAVALGIPLNGVDPELLHWGTKSGSREVFARAAVPHPAGYENLRSEGEVVDALLELADRRPGLSRAVVKLDESFSGEGNALFTYPAPLPEDPSARRAAIGLALERLCWSAPSENRDHYFDKLATMGGIVEEFLQGEEVHSPSVQMRITPVGEVVVVSTHDQILGGPTGQVYLGCRFPADAAYRATITEQALAIGAVLAELGIVSRFGIDFLVARDRGGSWRSHALEINLRMGGTTHPFLALQFLTGGQLDPSGCFVTPRGEERCYFATDTLKAPSYRGLLPEDLMDILVANGLQYRPATETGTLFHMIGALSQYGKVGVTCLAPTRRGADDLYGVTVASLDEETGAAHGRGGRPTHVHDLHLPDIE